MDSEAVLDASTYPTLHALLHATTLSTSSLPPQLARIARAQGPKHLLAVLHPSVHDLIPLLDALDSPLSPDVRYVVFLWLALLVLLPFDMSKFDSPSLASSSSSTALRIYNHSICALASPAIERDAAARLLARFLVRPDSISTLLPRFLDHCTAFDPHSSPLEATGIAQTLSLIVKTASLELLDPVRPQLVSLLSLYHPTQSHRSAAARKYGTKLRGRLALLLLPLSRFPIHRSRHIRILGSSQKPYVEERKDMCHRHQEIPDEVQSIIADLLDTLQDQDTFVRWSSAKYLARIAQRLPQSDSSEISLAVLDFFRQDIVDDDDLSAVQDRTWQGACLALAEFARLSILDTAQLPDIVQWIVPALSFDQRRRKKAVGSNIRDSASYLVYSLSRAFNARDLQPYILSLARSLIVTSMFDREIHIRRAASAAFQELVGRQGNVPHGIPVLRDMDFLTVSNRRKAFIDTSSKLCKYDEYRQAIIDRLLYTTITHWDTDMRKLGARALAIVAQKVGSSEWVRMIDLLGARLLDERDVFRRHGAIEALRALIDNPLLQFDLDSISAKILKYADLIKVNSTPGAQGTMIIIAVCNLIASCCSFDVLQDTQNLWSFIDAGLGKQTDEAHVASALAISKLSKFISPSISVKTTEIIFKCISALKVKSSSFKARTAQTSAPVLLSHLDYSIEFSRTSFDDAYDAIMKFITANENNNGNVDERVIVDRQTVKVSNLAPPVEARRNSYICLSRMVVYSGDDNLETAWKIFLRGLDDYTTDQRGDVGSWIRSACINAILYLHNQSTTTTAKRMAGFVQSTLMKLLRLSMELMDSVRYDAIMALSVLIGVENDQILMQLKEKIDNEEKYGWREISFTLVRVLESFSSFSSTSRYRTAVLRGLVESVGGTIETAPAPQAFTQYFNAHDDKICGIWFDALVEFLGVNGITNTKRVYLCTVKTLALLLESQRGTVFVGSLSPLSSTLLFQRAAAKIGYRTTQRSLAWMRIITVMYNHAENETCKKSVKLICDLMMHPSIEVRQEMIDTSVKNGWLPSAEWSTTWTADELARLRKRLVNAIESR